MSQPALGKRELLSRPLLYKHKHHSSLVGISPLSCSETRKNFQGRSLLHRTQLMEHIMSIAMNSAACRGGRSSLRYLPGPEIQYHNPSGEALTRVKKLSKKANDERDRFGPKISEIMKRKLRMLQVGGVKKVFKHSFNIREGERLLKASHCYLWTTAGPIAGLLFISSDRVAFCSEKPIQFSSSKGQQMSAHYKVMIPIKKVSRVNESENLKKSSEKYIEIVTKDDFDFWFMGFLNSQRTFKYLQVALSHA